MTAGCRIVVKFNNANTANSPTLNVNNLGAKNIYFQGTQITNGNTKNFLAGTCEFVYDGTGWCLIGGGGSATLVLGSDSLAVITTKETGNSAITIGGGTNKITVNGTYNGTATTVDVPITINIPNNVTQDSNDPIVNGNFVVGTGSGVVKDSGITFTDHAPAESSTDSTIPTSAAVYEAIQDAMGDLSGALVYKGTVDATHALPSSASVGDTYVVAAAGTYAGQACEPGDMIICQNANPVTWNVVNGENQVEDKAAVITTVASNTASPSKTTIATVDGTNLTEAIKHHHPSGAAAGTAGTSSATSGISIAIPYLTTDIDGHVTAKGTHTHTVTVADDGGLTYGGDYDGLGIVHDDTLKIASPTNELGINVDVGTNGMTNPSADADAWKHPIVSESGGSSNDGPTLSAGSGVGVTSSYADIPAATAGSTAANSTDGYMTGAQAYKLNGIAAGAQVNVLENVRLEGDSADLAKTSKRVTIPDMDGATASAAGAHGLVPKPAAGDQDKFLSGAGTWVTPTGTYTLPTATTSVKGGIKVGSGLTMGGTNNEVLSVVPDTSTIEIVDNELSVVFDEAEHATTVTTANA